MMEISVEVNHKEIEKALGALKSKSPEILKRAVNATARQAQTALFHEAKKTYVAKASIFKSKSRSLKLKRANNTNLTAHLQSEGGPLALYGFKVKATDESTKAKGLRASPLKNLKVGDRWAFVATMKSGHIGVFQRNTSSRLPIHEFFSVSIPQMIGNEAEVYGKLEPDFEDMLYKNIEREIEKYLSRQRS